MTARTADASDTIQALFQAPAIEGLLTQYVPLDESRRTSIRNPCVERCWPVGSDGVCIEWSFQVGSSQRYVLYGQIGSVDDTGGRQGADDNPRPHVSGDGLRGVYVNVPERSLLVHSPDQDPKMAQLMTCLDGEAMLGRLEPGRGETNGRSSAACVDCRLLGYRAGRRASIRYRINAEGAQRHKVLGKTFRDDRGRRLANRHAELNEWLKRNTGSRVRVPVCVAYVPDLRMVLLEWAPGNELEAFAPTSSTSLVQSADALAALHGARLNDLPAFTAADEYSIVQRWHGFLSRADPSLAIEQASLVTALEPSTRQLNSAGGTTVHRDFRLQQMVATEDTVTLIDLDTLAIGDACVDLGNFLAHLFLDVLQHPDGLDHLGVKADLFLRHYESRRGLVNRAALTFYLCTSLCRLGAVHALRRSTGTYAETLWRAASALLSAGPFEPMQWSPIVSALVDRCKASARS